MPYGFDAGVGRSVSARFNTASVEGLNSAMEGMNLHGQYDMRIYDELQNIGRRTAEIEHRVHANSNVLWEVWELANTNFEQAHEFYDHYYYQNP